MSEGMQAGRLEVTVVAALAGFASELRTKVESAAEGLAIQVQIEVNGKGLRRRLKDAVKEASKGVTAKVKVRVDRAGLRGELEEVARRAADSDVRVPVRPDGDRDGNRRGGLLGRLRELLRGAQGEADQNPVTVPFEFGGNSRRRRGRLRSLAMGAIVSIAQPAIGAITQYAAALTAMVGAAAPAVGVLGALPGLLAGAGTAAIAAKVAFGGVGEALKQTLKAQQQLANGTKLTTSEQAALDQSLKGLSSSARASVKTVTSLSGEWRKMKRNVQERFFSRISDEIKPLSSAVLPLLKSSLGDAASQMGGLAERGAKAMRSGPFAKDFKTVAATNSKVIGNVTDGVANLSAATGHFLAASAPFVERVSKAGKGFTGWLRSSAQAGRETGSLDKFLDHSAQKAKQLGRITLEAGKGIAGMGRAGQDAGNALLDGLEGTMIRFSRWANSGEGKRSMQQFFSDAAPTFHELNKLAGDFFRGLGRMAEDNDIRDLIVQIRTELMPGVGHFLDAIGSSVGPSIIGLVSNIASLFASLSSAGSGLGVTLGALNGLLNLFNGLLAVAPGLGTTLGVLLGAMLAFRMVSSVIGLLTRLGATIRSVGTVQTTTAAGAAAQTTLWQRVGTAYSTAAASGGRLTGVMRGVGSAAGVMRGSMSGLLGALGGPWGAAIAAVTIGIGLLANQHEKAAQAAQEQQSRINSLTQALRDSNGVIDANVRAQAAQLLQDTELADGKGKLVDVMRQAGISLGDLTSAYLGQGRSLGDLQKELQGTADAHTSLKTVAGQSIRQADDQGLAAMRASDALATVRGELEKGQKQQRELAAAANASGSAGTDSYNRLQSAVLGFSDKTKAADERVDSLKRALDELSGNAESFHDASARLNQQMLSIDETMKGNIDRSNGWGKALIDSDGLVQTASQNGQTLNTQLTELRSAMLGVATRAQEAAEQGVMPLAEAMTRGEDAMEKARAKAIALATDMGIPKKEAAALANQMGFIPTTITTLMTTQGIPEATAEFLSLRGKLDGLDKGKTITIKAPTKEAQHQIEALGFTVTRLPGGKKVTVTAPTQGARANVAALAQDIANAPDKKNVTVSAIVKKAAGELKGVQDKVASLPKGASIDVKAPTKTAQAALKDLGFKIKNVDNGGKVVRITAPNKGAIQQVQAIQSKINALTGKTVQVTVQYHSVGKPSVVTQKADGGIVKYADGGVRRVAGRVKAFANGAEKHIAQIAKAGEMRLWAEPETAPGEAYIPLAPSKRKRSEEILATVADFFGGSVIYPGRALKQYANGAVSVNRGASLRAPAPRSAVHAENTALVGGDLNLNFASVGNTVNALEDAMFELRRIRLGGGA